MIRFFDILLALIGLVVLLPFALLISGLIFVFSGYPVLYSQERVGIYGVPFTLLKFRTMYKDAHTKGRITIGGRDPRVTPVGYYLRKYKLDELPQLWNVLQGEMSIVGPRPEVQEYVAMYTAEQRTVLSVRPGITDLASIKFRNENEILAQSSDPHKTYVEEIMPLKINLNREFIQNPSLTNYFSTILLTIRSVFSGGNISRSLNNRC